MPRKRDRIRARKRRSAAGRASPSLIWVMAGDRSGVFGRSLAIACIGAVLWALALDWTVSHLGRGGGPPALAERLLLDVESGNRRQLADLARRLPAHFTVPEPTRRAIHGAAAAVGVDPGYLFGVAALESSFDPTARAHNTSAAGLFQFTEGTWLRVVKVFGARHGLGDFAGEITVDDDNNVYMPRGARRQALMRLRDDPETATLLAAELALDNQIRLERLLGRAVSPAEVYLAHFLGVGSAARMIANADTRPQVAGATLVPAAAETNPGVFGSADEPVSAGAIRARFESFFRDVVPRFAGT